MYLLKLKSGDTSEIIQYKLEHKRDWQSIIMFQHSSFFVYGEQSLAIFFCNKRWEASLLGFAINQVANNSPMPGRYQHIPYFTLLKLFMQYLKR